MAISISSMSHIFFIRQENKVANKTRWEPSVEPLPLTNLLLTSSYTNETEKRAKTPNNLLVSRRTSVFFFLFAYFVWVWPRKLMRGFASQATWSHFTSRTKDVTSHADTFARLPTGLGIQIAVEKGLVFFPPLSQPGTRDNRHVTCDDELCCSWSSSGTSFGAVIGIIWAIRCK